MISRMIKQSDTKSHVSRHWNVCQRAHSDKYLSINCMSDSCYLAPVPVAVSVSVPVLVLV